MEIDIEKLRQDLINYFGTAMYNASPLAILELTKIKRASSQELINIALKNNFDLTEYQIKNKSLF